MSLEKTAETKSSAVNQKVGCGNDSPPPEETLPKQPHYDWTSTLQDPDVVCEMRCSAERTGLTLRGKTIRSEESVVMIKDYKTNTYRIATVTGTQSHTTLL